MAATAGTAEMAFSLDNGHIAKKNQGIYGSVARPDAELSVGGHTHHRQTGHDYRKFNVPTPEDVMTFISAAGFIATPWPFR